MTVGMEVTYGSGNVFDDLETLVGYAVSLGAKVRACVALPDLSDICPAG